MIKQKVELISLEKHVEENVCISINNNHINCFAGNCPFPIVVGNKYDVIFSCSDFDVEKVDDSTVSIKRVNDAYSYRITGLLKKGTLHSVFKIYDDFLLSNYAYLDGCYVSMTIERLDVEFVG